MANDSYDQVSFSRAVKGHFIAVSVRLVILVVNPLGRVVTGGLYQRSWFDALPVSCVSFNQYFDQEL